MKLGLGAGLSSRLVELVEFIQPRFVIPTHYRTDRKSDPIPAGHWPPNVTDEMAFIESIREIVGNRTQLLPLTCRHRIRGKDAKETGHLEMGLVQHMGCSTVAGIESPPKAFWEQWSYINETDAIRAQLASPYWESRFWGCSLF